MRTLLLLLILLQGVSSGAQSFQTFKSLIDLDEETVLNTLKEEGYEVVEELGREDCHGFKFKRDSTTIIYNVCPEEEGDLINVNLIGRNEEIVSKFLIDAKKDLTLSYRVSTVGANSSFIFEDELLEIYFIFDHLMELYIMEISNSYRYDFMKEMLEEKTAFNPETNGISYLRKILGETNSKGAKIDDLPLTNKMPSYWNATDLEKAEVLFKEFKETEEFEKLKIEVDTQFFQDPVYMEKIKKSLWGMQLWYVNEEIHHERMEDTIYKIAVENNHFISLPMLDYIISTAENR